jgi:putative MATE family efflux protein
MSKLKSLFGPQDMTVGKPIKPMLLFTVPILLGNVLQLLYNTVDRLVVGRYCGQDALGALGASMGVQLMFSVFFMTVGTGVSVIVSQYFGAKDKDSLSKTVGSSLILTLIATAFAAVLGILLTDWLLNLTNCPPQIYDHAKSYMVICFYGFVGMGFYNVLGGTLRGLGDSTFPLFALALTTVLNVILDIWMVASPEQLPFGLGLGVGGAALATIIAQTISAIACLWRLSRMKEIVELNRKTVRLHKAMVNQIGKIGLPSGLQQMIQSMSGIFVQSLINGVAIPFGGGFDTAMFVSVNTAVVNVDQFAMLPAQTFSMTASTYAGQNIGAGRIDRVMRGFKVILLTAVGLSLIVMVAIFFNGRGLMELFITDPDNPARALATIDLGVRMQRLILPVYLIMAISNVVGGIMRGAGDTMSQMWIMITSNIVFRIPLAAVWMNATKNAEYPGGKPEVIILTMIAAFGLNVIINCIYFATGRWKKKSVVKTLQ